MANIKKFSDYTGEAVELEFQNAIPNAEFAARFPGVKGIRYNGYSMCIGRATGSTQWLPVTRKIEYKSFPSKHECNAKCLGGKHTGKCECKCGGKNHGAGMFSTLLQAA
jgi:hypothetical protein